MRAILTAFHDVYEGLVRRVTTLDDTCSDPPGAGPPLWRLALALVVGVVVPFVVLPLYPIFVVGSIVLAALAAFELTVRRKDPWAVLTVPLAGFIIVSAGLSSPVVIGWLAHRVVLEGRW